MIKIANCPPFSKRRTLITSSPGLSNTPTRNHRRNGPNYPHISTNSDRRLKQLVKEVSPTIPISLMSSKYSSVWRYRVTTNNLSVCHAENHSKAKKAYKDTAKMQFQVFWWKKSNVPVRNNSKKVQCRAQEHIITHILTSIKKGPNQPRPASSHNPLASHESSTKIKASHSQSMTGSSKSRKNATKG